MVDANAHFGYPSALLLDESAFGKKGNRSAGVARQWNGRLAKVDNGQVGVFAAVIMRHRLPTKIVTDEDLAASIIDRHRRWRQAMESAYRKQAAMLEASD